MKDRRTYSKFCNDSLSKCPYMLSTSQEGETFCGLFSVVLEPSLENKHIRFRCKSCIDVDRQRAYQELT